MEGGTSSVTIQFFYLHKTYKILGSAISNEFRTFELYGQTVADQETKRFIEKVDNFKTNHAHYIHINHRADIKDLATTPVRIADASSHSTIPV